MGGEVLLSAFCSREVCVLGFSRAVWGAIFDMALDISLSAGKLLLSANFVASFRNEFFFILSVCSHLSTICLHGFSSSILLNLSSVRAVDLSLLNLKGSMFESISQALVGVVLRAPHTNRRPWFCRRSSLSWLVLLAVACRGAE